MVEKINETLSLESVRQPLQEKTTNIAVTPLKQKAQDELRPKNPNQSAFSSLKQRKRDVTSLIDIQKCYKKLRIRLALAMYKIKSSSEHIPFNQLRDSVFVPHQIAARQSVNVQNFNSLEGCNLNSCQSGIPSNTCYKVRNSTLNAFGDITSQNRSTRDIHSGFSIYDSSEKGKQHTPVNECAIREHLIEKEQYEKTLVSKYEPVNSIDSKKIIRHPDRN